MRHFRTAGEPLGIGPALQHGLGIGVAAFGQDLHVVEEVEYQQGLFQAFGGDGANLGVAQQVDHRLDVVTAQHGAQQFGRGFARNQRRLHAAFGDGGQERSFDLGGVVDTRRHAVSDQLDQCLFFACWRVLQQFNQFFDLFGGQRQWWNAQCGAFCDMLAVSF
ncbi:hypothetical protein D3C85_1377220 [compost metagenome]